MRALRLIPLVVGAFVGCATPPSVTFHATSPYAATMRALEPDDVVVYTLRPQDVASFELGRLHTDEQGEPRDVLARLQREAARHGCDAVVLDGPRTQQVYLFARRPDPVATTDSRSRPRVAASCLALRTPSGAP